MTNEVIEVPSKTSRTGIFIKFILFLGLGLVIIWLSLRGLTPGEKNQILQSFRIANYNWVVLTIFLGIGSHILRSLRWIMFFSPMGYTPSFKNTFFAVMIGYFANLAFPRLGEVTRCGILAKYEKIPFNKSFGTVITERAVDMICFLVIFLLMILTQVGTISNYLDNSVYPKLVAKFGNLHYSRMFVISLAGTAAVLLAVFFLVRNRIREHRFYLKIKSLVTGFWEGLKSLSQIRKPWLFLAYTVAIWTLYYFMLYIVFFCFPDTASLTPGAGLSSLVLGSVGIMITPGGIGLYPAIIQETLVLYDVAKTTGLALGWIAWVAQTGMIILVGGLSLLLLSFNKLSHGKA